MYAFFKWVIDPKRSSRKIWYFAFFIPDELLVYLNTSELELKDNISTLTLRKETYKRTLIKADLEKKPSEWKTWSNHVSGYSAMRKKALNLKWY